MKTSTALFTTLLSLALVELGFALRRSRDRGCKYDKPAWGECDTTTDTMSRTLTLRPNSDETCEATKTVTKPCSGGRGEGRGDKCKYDRTSWGDCDVTTNTKSRTLTLRHGVESQCEATKTETKPCGKGGAQSKNGKRNRGRKRGKNKIYSCQYSVADRSECDDVTKTRTLTLTLKRGLPDLCEQSKSLTRPCQVTKEDKNGCTYGPPEVSDCVDNVKTITKTLTDGDSTVCEQTKTKTKKCGGREGRKGKKGGKKGRKNRRKNALREQDDTE